MKGLELSERFYREYGEPLLKETFSDIMPYIATGLCGSGSECLGYDDDVSADHDFEPGFCIFLPGEDTVDRKLEFRLERAYAGLPKEFLGHKRSPLSPVGGNRHGVIRSDRFFTEKTGTPDGTLSTEQWLKIPEYSLLEATNGRIYHDGDGRFSSIRDHLSAMPEEQKQKFLDYIEEELEVRIGERISRGLTEEQLNEFDMITDQDEATKWLEQNRPDYREIVNRTIEELKAEIRANRARLVGA